jgi:hypothetical protein
VKKSPPPPIASEDAPPLVAPPYTLPFANAPPVVA